MSNPLSVRRVKVQTINADGSPDGEPTYGVMAADDYQQSYNDTFFSLEDLNKAINDAPSILSIVLNANELFDTADHTKIGHDNFFGKNWELGEDDEDDED